MHIDRDACRKRWAPFAGSIKLHSNTEGFASIHYLDPSSHEKDRTDWQPSDESRSRRIIPTASSAQVQFHPRYRVGNCIAIVALLGCKYPALMSFAIISLSLEREANGVTSLIHKFRNSSDGPAGNSSQYGCQLARTLMALTLTSWLEALRRASPSYGQTGGHGFHARGPCLEGIDRNVPVTIEPAAAKLLMPNTVRTVAEILARTGWPAEQLRLVVERWQPAAEVRTDR
jgi:hypothetical protein